MPRIDSVADFVAEETACGRALLGLVARGHVILAEMCRLERSIPAIVSNPPSKYAPLLPDFKYFHAPEAFDENLDKNENLKEMDDELRENYVEILSKLFACFESIHRYAIDLNRFVEELEEGVYVQRNLETVFANKDGKQLMSEALHLYGVCLLYLDAHFLGSVRERILVAYYRFSAESWSGQSSISDVCTLLRSTGFSPGAKRPPDYPQSLFGRVQMNKQYVSMVINALRGEDLYSQTFAFPLGIHRSTALSTQSSMIVVCLYFSPDTLKSNTAAMREVVDKFFPDNWTINVYMGSLMNLLYAWEPYEAAKAALNTCHTLSNAKTMSQKQGQEMNDLSKILSNLLNERTLNNENVLSKSDKLIKLQRRCNVCLRWLYVHTYIDKNWYVGSKLCRTMQEAVLQGAKIVQKDIFHFLLLVSQFEAKLKEKLTSLLQNKQWTCVRLRKDIAERLAELALVFSGQKPLTRVEKKDKLQQWFKQLEQEMLKLNLEENTSMAYSKLVQVSRALQKAEEMYTLNTDTTVSQFMIQLRAVVKELMLVLGLREDTLVMVETVADMAYAWNNAHQYISLMQADIKKNPSDAVKLRATFLKLGTSLQIPLVRLEQAESWNFSSISAFYSRVLVDFMRAVLQIVPQTVFNLLSQIATLQTSKIPELPTRLEKDKLKDVAEMDARYEVARLTHDISVLTEGVLMLRTMSIGVVTVEPRQLLHDGIRKELVKLVASNLNRILSYNKNSKDSNDLFHLSQLACEMAGLRRSLTYISDYMNMSGWKIWHEQFSRIINYYIELECNALSRHKISDEESLYQSSIIPIPTFVGDSLSPTCIGRLTRLIVLRTEPKDTIYIDSLGTWYDCKTKEERANPNLFLALNEALGNIGLCGMSKLISFMVCEVVLRATQLFHKQVLNVRSVAESFQATRNSFGAIDDYLDNPLRVFTASSQLSSTFDSFLNKTLKVIGQLLILRHHLLKSISSTAQFQCKLLLNSAAGLNQAILHELKDGSSSKVSADSPLLYELSTYLDAMGLTDSFHKLYVDTRSMDELPDYIMLSLIFIASKFTSQSVVGETYICKKVGDNWDMTSLSIGCACLLFHNGSQSMHIFMRRCLQFIKSVRRTSISTNDKEWTGKHEALFLSKFLSQLGSFKFVQLESIDNQNLLL